MIEQLDIQQKSVKRDIATRQQENRQEKRTLDMPFSFEPEHRLESHLAYWRTQLAGVPALLELPTDRPRSAAQRFVGAQQSILLQPDLLQALMVLSQSEGVTLFMTLLAAFQVLLMRHSRQEDIVVSTPIAHRPFQELDDMAGMFINTLILRTDLSGNPSFQQILSRVREVTLGAYEHPDLPVERIIEALSNDRSSSYTSLFQVIIALQNRPQEALTSDKLSWQPVNIEGSTATFDLKVILYETEQGLQTTIEYSTDLFDVLTIERMLDHWQILLQDCVARPECAISDLTLLPAAEATLLVETLNATQYIWPSEVTLPQLFEQQVQQTPDAIAIVFDEQQLTYQELNVRANQLAHCLLREGGVGPDMLVGVIMERSLELMIALFAILKAGGAYVPIDPSYPQERLLYILQEAHIALLLTQPHLVDRFSAAEIRIISIQAEMILAEDSTTPERTWEPAHLAYVIYTSGSTGVPKGVGVSHASWMNLLHWFIRDFNFTTSDTSAIVTSHSFDLTQKDLFAPLLVGGKVSLLAPGYDTFNIRRTLLEQEITLFNCTPSMFYPLIETNEMQQGESFHQLRWVFLGGEPIVMARIKDWMKSQQVQARIVNTYGPTECTDVVVFNPLEPSSQDITTTIPMGRPVPNTQIYLLDSYQQLVPVGVPGELYIGGVSLARGYLRRADLTAERFIPHPFSQTPGARLYRTGDLARYRADGNIEYLSRLDHQVKLRGFRLEPDEIAAVLRQHEAVHDCAVIMSQDQSGENQLVAYVIAETGISVIDEQLRSYLCEHLPYYMIPSHFVALEAFPLTVHGKLDYQSLPAPAIQKREQVDSFVTPRTVIEEVVAGIYADILSLDQVGVYDSFFSLGGHSLSATRVLSRLLEIFHIEISFQQFFATPTTAELAAYIEQQGLSMHIDVGEISQLVLYLNDLTEEELSVVMAQELCDINM